MKIVGFGHRKRVGKDTAGKFLMSYIRQERKTLTVERGSSGDIIKDTAYRMFKWAGLNDGVYYENHPEHKDVPLATVGKSPRQIWIDVGNFGRSIAEKTWMEAMLSNVGAQILVITDLRTQTEIDYVRKFGGIAIRIDRDVERGDDNLDNALADYDGWDAIIDNNGSLRDFRTRIISVFEEALDVGKL